MRNPVVKKKKAPVSLVFSLTLVLILISAFLFIYFDLAGSKLLLAGILQLPQENPQETVDFSSQLNDIEDKAAQIRLDEANLASRQAQLDKNESDLKKRQQELDRQELVLADEKKQLLDKSASLKETSALLEAMDPARAAEIISQLTSQSEMARVLGSVSSQAAARIMEKLETGLATDILREMMG